MKTIVLATVTLLSVSGMAFAGSDNYGSGYIPGSSTYPTYPGAGHSVDMSSTKSISMAGSKSAAHGTSAFDMPAPGYGQGIWGR